MKGVSCAIFNMGTFGGTYIDIKFPMKPPINPQPRRERPIRQQRLRQNRAQNNGHRIIIPEPRDINAQLHPLIIPPPLPPPPLLILLIYINESLARAGLRSRALDFRFHAYDGLGAVREADACGAVGGGEDVGFGCEGAELRGGARVGAEGGVQGERGVEVGELGGGEEEELCGGWCHFGGCASGEARDGRVCEIVWERGCVIDALEAAMEG